MIKSTLYLIKYLVKHFSSHPDTFSVLSFASCYFPHKGRRVLDEEKSRNPHRSRLTYRPDITTLLFNNSRTRGHCFGRELPSKSRLFRRCPLCTLEKKNRGRRALYMYVSTRTKGSKYSGEIRIAAHLLRAKLGESTLHFFDFRSLPQLFLAILLEIRNRSVL